ncbi:MAG: threonine/serine exporter family protein [Chloroflexi bacterium]|nr:threonine/serine exporter family protein [Chloroflexota bacterium]
MVNPFKPETVPSGRHKPPLNYEELRDVIDLALWAGQLLLQYGADTQLVEETIHRLGTGLGCDWMDILVSPNAVVITAHSGLDFRTKVRRVVSMTVNMTILTEVSAVTRRVIAGDIDRFELRKELLRISTLPRNYNRWMVVLMVGLACAAFSRLFGADWPVFIVTFFAAAGAMFVRQELQRHHFNALLVTIATAFVAGLLASAAPLLRLGEQPSLALASAVLLLVPGVPLINAAEDLIKGHLVTGIVRGITGGLLATCIALGLLLAMSLMGVNGL